VTRRCALVLVAALAAGCWRLPRSRPRVAEPVIASQPPPPGYANTRQPSWRSAHVYLCHTDDDCVLASFCCVDCCVCRTPMTREELAWLDELCADAMCAEPRDCRTVQCDPCPRFARAVCVKGACVGG
jgi:hypothetical protein